MPPTEEGNNPGIIWCNSIITKESDLSRDTFATWYQQVHLPDVLKTGAVAQALRYEAANPNEALFHLALYYAPTMTGLFDAVSNVPHHHPEVPGSHDIFDYAFFDTRFYKLVQSYAREDDSSDPADFCLSTEMTPADAKEFDDWYRQEHLQDGSKIRGWRRTERYELLEAFRAPDAPRFLTLLFLDGDSIPLEDLQKAGGSPWTQKILAGMKQIRSVAFKKPSGRSESKL